MIKQRGVADSCRVRRRARRNTFIPHGLSRRQFVGGLAAAASLISLPSTGSARRRPQGQCRYRKGNRASAALPQVGHFARAHAYDRRHRNMRRFDQPNAWADGWTGAFMHAWAPEYIGSGLWRLHNQPWGDEQGDQPEVTGVDYSAAGVSEAWFERSEQTLHVACAPGPLGLLQTTFAVMGCDPRVPVELLHEGDPATTLKPGSASGRAARSAGGTVRVEFDPRKAARFALKSMS